MFIDWLPEVLRSWRPVAKSSTRRKRAPGNRGSAVVAAERLEDRTLLSFTWQAEGPSPILNGQVEGMTSQNNPDAGAVQTVVADPLNANILYAGTVNGGVWKTTNASSPTPTWTALTSTQSSMSIGAMDLDPTDPTNKTLVAGFGQTSAAGDGGPRDGLIRTINGGLTWTPLGVGTAIDGGNVSGVIARGQIIVVGTNGADNPSNATVGMFRSANGGASFQEIGAAGGLPFGTISDLEGSPTSPNILFATVTNAGAVSGVYRSIDTGATWTLVSNAAMNTLFVTSGKAEISVGRANNVFVGILGANSDLAGLFRSGDGGATWTALDLPSTTDGGVQHGLNPIIGGSASFLHLSIAADPQNPNLVYVGGYLQPGPYPNALGASTASGRLFRVDGSLASGSQSVSLTNNGSTSRDSSPHAQSRDITFDAAGNLIEADGGGVYKRVNPRVTGDWSSLNGNLQIAEIHSIAYDSVSNVLIGGTQDTGTIQQSAAGSQTWKTIAFGDGGVVAVDDQTFAAQGQSIRYTTTQNLNGFERQTVDANGNVISTVPVGLKVGNQGLLGVDPNVPYFPLYVLNSVLPTQGVLGTQTVYESFNQFDNLVNISGPTGSRITAMAYGGYYQGVANPDVLYYASANNIYLREHAGDTPIQLTNYPGGSVQDIVLDPADYHHAFVIDLTNVYSTSDGGLTWQTITGNVDQLATGQLRSIEYVDLPGTSTDALVVGATGGVFADSLATPNTWSVFGVGLPDSIVTDIEYDTTDDVLAIGTLGNGAYIMNDASFTFNPPTKTGTVNFNKSVYQIGDTVDITVRDIDLINTGILAVNIVADSGDQESVQLTEIPGTGVFRGQIGTATTDNGFLLHDGTLEVDRGSTITVTYQDASNANGLPQTDTDTAQLFTSSSLDDFTFTDPNGQATTDGFTTSGPTSQWHLSVGHGLDSGHSQRDSFYFGSGESLSSTGAYSNNSSGTLTSPVLSLVGATGPVFLEWNQLLDAEDQFDTATVRVITSSGSTIVASNNGLSNMPDSTLGAWVHERIDLSGFIGQQIQVSFSFSSNATITHEGWYVDDVQLTGTAGEVQGSVWQDSNGDGVRNLGEPGLPGWTVFADGNGDGVPDDSVQTFPSTPGVVAIADNNVTDSTIAVSNVNGLLDDVNVSVTILHPHDADLSLVLISPSGTRIPLVSGIAGNGSNFSGTTFDDQAGTGIQTGIAPYAGAFKPQSPLSLLNGEPANGTWTLEITDSKAGNVGTLINWSLTTSVMDPTTVTNANGDYTLGGLRAGTYTIAEVAPTGWQQTFPQTSPLASSTYTVTLGTGQLVTGLIFGNQFVFPIVTTPSGDLTYTENDPPVIIDGRATVTDINTDTSIPQLPAFANGSLLVSLTQNGTVDDRLIIRNQGTGAGQIGVSGNSITYGGVFIGTFTGGDGFNPLSIKFNVQATQAAVQALVRDIQFYVVGDNPSPLTRTVEFVLTDNKQGISIPVDKLIHVIPVNDAPVVTLSPGPMTFNENDPPTPVDLFSTVTDPDSPDFNGGYLQVSLIGNASGPVTNTRHVFNAVDTPYVLNNNTITSRISTLGLNGTLTDVNVTVNITHTNDADLIAYLISPSGTRVRLFSNVGANTFGFSTVQNFTNTTFDDSADVPIESAFATAPFTGSFLPEKELFVVNGEDPNGFWSLEITDLKNSLLNDGTGILNSWSVDLGLTEVSTNETLTILNQGANTGEIGLVGNRVTYSGDVIGTFKGGVGTTPLVVNLNANATQVAVQALMENVAIQIQGDNPVAGTRQVEFTVNDGDGGTSIPQIRTVTVVPVNDNPVLTLPSGQSAFIEGSAPVVLDVFATVSDIDSPNFNNGMLTVSLGATATPADRLAIRATGQNPGQINLVGTSVRYGTTTIGTFAGGSGSTPLTVNFNSNATPDAVQALVRSITFQAVGASPSTTPRVVKFQITDGRGGATAIVSKTISVSQINDPPVLTLSTTTIPPDPTLVSQVIYNASGLPTQIDNALTISDPDNAVFNGGRLTVTLISGSSTRDRLAIANQGFVVVSGTNVSFAGVLVGKLTPGIGSAPLTVDFNSSASIEAVQAVARAVTFQIIGPSPTVGNRIAAFQVTDGSGGTSQPQNRTIIVQTTNQPPVNTVPLVDYKTLEDTPVSLTGLGVADPDASLQPIQVTLNVAHGKINVLSSVPGGVTAAEITGNGTNQVVMNADQDSINATLQAINAVRYQGVLDYNGQDTLTMTSNDLGNSGPGGQMTDIDSVFIDIQAVHDNAKITPTATVATNVRGKEAFLDTGITSQLGDGQTSMANAILSVNVTTGRNRSDRLEVLSEGKNAGQINVVAGKSGKPSSLRIGSLTIGTVTGGENGVALKIVFNANATAADLQHVLRSITFRTAVQTTVYGLRTVTYNFTDNLGIAASPATKQVNVVRQ
ncbi:MAG: sodium/calcium exchanger 1 [Planctomycetaceae bacterium]|nr:sodium/calcium exchanger 1 [Planctomycetaceae bacterium]